MKKVQCIQKVRKEEILINDKADKVIEELFESLLNKYQMSSDKF